MTIGRHADPSSALDTGTATNSVQPRSATSTPAASLKIERFPAQAKGSPCPLTILVAVASIEDRGWTVGRAIAEALTERGSDVDLMRLGTARDAELDPGTYDAVVLGSDVHAGR